MSVTTRRRRSAPAVGIAALTAVLLAAGPALAAGPYDGRVVESEGHSDAFYIQKDATGEPELVIHSDTNGSVAPETLVYHAKPSVATRTAGALVAATLGIPTGSQYFLLPQTNQAGQLFVGFGYDTADYPAGSIQVTHTVSNVDGPGDLVLWQNSEDGPQVFISTVTGVAAFTSWANHEHVNWGFTAEGEYTFDVVSTFEDDGVAKTTAPRTYTFFVGEELPQDEPGPGPETLVTVTGAAAHYHAGEAAVLTAVQAPAEISADVRWSGRASAADAWAEIPSAGDDPAVLAFIVTSEREIKAVVRAADGSVVAESDPVEIHVDDHGNDPVIGPEINVSHPLTDGALVISVAADSRVAQLSDLTLNPAADRLVSEGSIGGITVTDTRAGDLGWTANGRVRELVAADGDRLAGRYVGWTPEVLSTSAGQDVTAGGAVVPGLETGAGIQGWSTLGTAPAGASRGTAVLGAGLRIEAPTSTAVGDYVGVVLITVI